MIVVAAVVAFWLLLRNVLLPSPHRRIAVATGVALWALVPPFLHASTQVRTDQPAILFGLLGGIALLASVHNLRWAPLAGLLFATGFLFSQKLLYVGGLVAVLAVGQLAMRGEWRHGRSLMRAGAALTVFIVILLAYRGVMERAADGVHMLPVASQLGFFEDYRAAIGWRVYRTMLPSLIPQLIAAASVVPLTLLWLRQPERHGAAILTAWLVTAVGFVVLLFHSGRLPYFWMVMGLFPATLAALTLGPWLDRVQSAPGRKAGLAVIWVPLLYLAVTQAGAMTIEDQQHQRASLEFCRTVVRCGRPRLRGTRCLRLPPGSRPVSGDVPTQYTQQVRRA
jgi:hypothetical protein